MNPIDEMNEKIKILQEVKESSRKMELSEAWHAGWHEGFNKAMTIAGIAQKVFTDDEAEANSVCYEDNRN